MQIQSVHHTVQKGQAEKKKFIRSGKQANEKYLLNCI